MSVPVIPHQAAEAVGDLICARWAALAGDSVPLPFPEGDLRWADLVQAVLRHAGEDEQRRAEEARPEPGAWR